MSNELQNAAELISAGDRIFVLTGAGMSAESGVPTFRGGRGAGVSRGMPFTILSSAEMVEKDLPLVWEWSDFRRSVLAACKPNAGHMTLAKAQLGGRFESFKLVTCSGHRPSYRPLTCCRPLQNTPGRA